MGSVAYGSTPSIVLRIDARNGYDKIYLILQTCTLLPASESREHSDSALPQLPRLPPTRSRPTRAGNPEGDRRFRADREEWYEAIMGEPLADGAAAWQRCDSVARRYRVDHTRSGRPDEVPRAAREMSGPRCVECGCNGCECAPPEEDPEYAFDDY